MTTATPNNAGHVPVGGLEQPAARYVDQRDRWLIYRLRYFPALLFLAFLASNTRFQPLSGWMLIGRWPSLFAIAGLVLLTVIAAPRRMTRWPWASGLMIVSFGTLLFAIPFSNNPTVSFAKWLAYFVFLVFCGLYFGMIRHREDAVWVLTPMIWVFVAFIWFMPPSVFLFPQRLYALLGSINGFLLFTDALGSFMLLFGIPGCLFAAQTARTQRMRWFFVVTLLIGCWLIFGSGSRTAAFALVSIYGIAFWRWKTWEGRWVMPLKIAIIAGALMLVPGNLDRIERFVLKYPTAEGLLESRDSYWSATFDSFQDNRWLGTGFGVQTQQSGARLSFNTEGQFREQGSAYLGMLEEIGLFGSVPLFAIYFFLLARHGLLLIFSNDSLLLMQSRIIVAGLIWGGAENYILYLGGAGSILLAYGIFLGERLIQLESQEREAQRWNALSRRQAQPVLGTPALARVGSLAPSTNPPQG